MMNILIDYSNLYLRTLLAHPNVNELSQDLIRHLLLVQLLNIKRKFSNSHSDKIILCCDDKRSWRKGIFSEYKQNRKKSREQSSINWSLIYETMDSFKLELNETFKYYVLQFDNVEADDIIASLANEGRTSSSPKPEATTNGTLPSLPPFCESRKADWRSPRILMSRFAPVPVCARSRAKAL